MVLGPIVFELQQNSKSAKFVVENYETSLKISCFLLTCRCLPKMTFLCYAVMEYLKIVKCRQFDLKMEVKVMNDWIEVQQLYALDDQEKHASK